MDSTEKKYASCCAYENGGCGPYLRYRKPVDQLFEISDLINNTKAHLVKLKLMRISDTSKLSEIYLIENRLGKIILPDKKICAYHRFTLGIEWRQLSSCQHQDHIQVKGKKAPVTRAAPINLLEFMKNNKMTIPIGSKLCVEHLKSLTLLRTT